ncbi:hypothetical protein ZHAS_00020536 [Anopheles sinensis]|uniref:Uncharacterized protein n=1 Tax=Anopheles sinensis TaxID=74873 RepID=A0A084WQ10_ANOSI|nr:hypothetical protein ZHAS_00020536 [Anopheles sinensis]
MQNETLPDGMMNALHTLTVATFHNSPRGSVKCYPLLYEALLPRWWMLHLFLHPNVCRSCTKCIALHAGDTLSWWHTSIEMG